MLGATVLSNLEQLIAELCPDGVEYVKIKDVYTRLKGTPITAGKMKEIENPSGDIRIFAGGKTVISAFEKDIPNANITRVPSVLVQSRGVIDAVYYEGAFTFKNEMWAYTADDKTSVRYLFYVLKSNMHIFRDAASGMGSLPQISLKVTEDFIVPLPPLPVQREIVRILDNFTELTAELTARKKQYEYYRLQIVNKANDNNFVPIRSLGNWTGGSTPSMAETTYWENGTIPWVSSKDMKLTTMIDTQDHISQKALAETSIKLLPKNTVAIVARSGILKHTLPVVYIPFETTVNQDIKALVTVETVLPKYAYFVINAFGRDILKKTKKQGGTVDSLDVNAFMNYQVPVPPLEEQQRIVTILDRFDALCNDLTNGLPAEIEARKKQYEYYRDKLLTFKEKKA